MRIEKCVSGLHTCRIGIGTDLVKKKFRASKFKKSKKKNGDVLPSCGVFLQGFNADTYLITNTHNVQWPKHFSDSPRQKSFNKSVHDQVLYLKL